jgi:azurin
MAQKQYSQELKEQVIKECNDVCWKCIHGGQQARHILKYNLWLDKRHQKEGLC